MTGPEQLAPYRAASPRSALLAATAVGLATIGAAVYGTAVDSPFTWIYVGVTVLLVAIVAAVHRSIGFSSGVLAAMAVAAIGNLAGGVLLVDGDVLYEQDLIEGTLRFDQVLHFYATAVATWASWQALRGWVTKDGGRLRPEGGTLVVILLLGLGNGAVVEVVEFFGSQLIPNSNVGDYVNTGWDLTANLLGAGVATGLIWWTARRDERS